MWKLFLWGIGMSIGFTTVIWCILEYIGIRKIKSSYLKDYETLVRAVREYKVTNRNIAVIDNKFKAIWKYRCRDKERLDVLYDREFYNRFKAGNNDIVLTKNGDNEKDDNVTSVTTCN